MKTEIPFKKKRQFLHLAVSTVAFAVMLYLTPISKFRIVAGDSQEYTGQYTYLKWMFCLLVIFAFLVLRSLFNIIINKKAIILDDNGITLKSHANGGKNIGTIKWKDISSASLSRSGSKTVLDISVNNPWDYYKRIPDNRSTAVFKQNLEKKLKLGNIILQIPSTVPDIAMEELQRMVQERIA